MPCIQPATWEPAPGSWSSFCPTALGITACSKVLASTALCRTKMKFSSQVFLAATSRRMAHSPPHPAALRCWQLVGYTDGKNIYPKNPAAHQSKELSTELTMAGDKRATAKAITSSSHPAHPKGCLIYGKRPETSLAAGCSCYPADFH